MLPSWIRGLLPGKCDTLAQPHRWCSAVRAKGSRRGGEATIRFRTHGVLLETSEVANNLSVVVVGPEGKKHNMQQEGTHLVIRIDSGNIGCAPIASRQAHENILRRAATFAMIERLHVVHETLKGRRFIERFISRDLSYTKENDIDNLINYQ